jgi:hypothetical protein
MLVVDPDRDRAAPLLSVPPTIQNGGAVPWLTLHSACTSTYVVIRWSSLASSPSMIDRSIMWRCRSLFRHVASSLVDRSDVLLRPPPLPLRLSCSFSSSLIHPVRSVSDPFLYHKEHMPFEFWVGL